MKCVVNLYDVDNTIEIVIDLADCNIHALRNYKNKKNMSSNELIEDLIEGYIKDRGL